MSSAVTVKSRGRAKGRGQSSKAKGRRGCQAARDLILAAFPHLAPDDVLVKATSQAGTDLHLSPAAARCLPFGIEVKRVEALNIWAALEQARLNAEKKILPPLVFFSRAHSDDFVALRAVDFLALLQKDGNVG